MTASAEDLSSDVVLRDGSTVRLRALRSEDRAGLTQLYDHLSRESRYLRFFSMAKMDQKQLARLMDVDGEGHFCLVAETGGRILADAHYMRDPSDPTRAEVAFAIADTAQGRGIGTRMLERLAEIAHQRGVTTFVADVLGDNHRMMDVFLQSGFALEQRLEGGVYQVTMPLELRGRFADKAAERAQHAAAASMRPFFAPRSVAVVGASRREGAIGGAILRNLRKTGFAGPIYPVNPSATEVDGVRAWSRMADIPGPVDLAVIAVPAAQVYAAVDDCIAKAVRALVVISAGFAETGADGRRREAALLDKVRAAGIRMIGPNCMGILSTDPAVRLNATFAPQFPPIGNVGFATQSGALGLAILDYAQRLGLGISSFASLGNKADVSGNDLIQYWAEDARTSVILLYLESFGNPRTFGRLARRVARTKPIVAVKAGRSKAGARAAASHTGALAASDAVTEGLFRQAGVIRTRTLEELFDVTTLLAHQPLPAGRRVAILTNAGGPGILAADACEAEGLELPALSDATAARLREFLPAAASIANPVDMIASATPEQFRRAMGLLLADERIDALLTIYIPPLVTQPAQVAAAIAEGASQARGKTVAAVFMSAQGPPAALAGVPSYSFPEAAATALARAASYGAWRHRPAGEPARFDDFATAEIRHLIEAALTHGGGWLAPLEAQSLMAAGRIPAAQARFAAQVEDAVAAARAIGFPVALKAAGPTILHKSDVGGVKLGLGDEAAVRTAFADLQARLRTQLAGVLVQEMVSGGVEMLVGTLQDPTFGPLLAYGSGGTLVELLGDVAFRLLPIGEGDLDDLLAAVKGTAVLRGHRGLPPADERALRELLLRVSALLDLAPEIQELDLNPVKVLPSGVRAVDARVRVGVPPARPPSRRIAY